MSTNRVISSGRRRRRTHSDLFKVGQSGLASRRKSIGSPIVVFRVLFLKNFTRRRKQRYSRRGEFFGARLWWAARAGGQARGN